MPAAAPPMELEEELAALGYADQDGAGSAERKKESAKPRARAARQARDEAKLDDAEAPGGGKDRGEGESETRTRAWFPESFLWQPMVLTDDDGVASVDVRVPDQLTTWRVLGLAHDRAGHQAGAVHTFDSRLPLYVDPVIPGWLYAGDQLDLPVQVVNTTEASVNAVLRAESSSALSGAGEVSLDIGPSDSDVVNVRLSAVAAGTGKVSASLRASEGNDRAEREIPVLPEGRPVEKTRGGTLAGERSFSMFGPDDADPTTEELTIRVFPGPLAVLQNEVERLQGGARPDDGAYGFALSSQMGVLAQEDQLRSRSRPGPAPTADRLAAHRSSLSVAQCRDRLGSARLVERRAGPRIGRSAGSPPRSLGRRRTARRRHLVSIGQQHLAAGDRGDGMVGACPSGIRGRSATSGRWCHRAVRAADRRPVHGGDRPGERCGDRGHRRANAEDPDRRRLSGLGRRALDRRSERRLQPLGLPAVAPGDVGLDHPGAR